LREELVDRIGGGLAVPSTNGKKGLA
jgi:hypothetical protein